MIALRKPQAPDTMTGGYRWDFMGKLLTSGIDLSSDSKLLLYVLVTHHGDERRVNPGLRRLAEMCSMSNGRCMAARDELIAAGLITCTLGAGTRSSEYHLIALDAWYAERVAARSSVRNSSASVPDSRSSVHPVRTNPSESSESRKEPPAEKSSKVIELAPATGWHALMMRAPDDLRLRWLDKLTFHGVDADGRITLSTDNPAIAAKVRTLLGEMAGLAGVARGVGVDPDKVVIRSRRHGFDPLPPDLQVLQPTKAGLDEAAQRIENASSGPIEPMPRAVGPNVSSLAAYRTRLQPPTDTAFRSGQGSPPDTEDLDET